MKRIHSTLLIAFMAGCMFCTSAETVFLKNGSIIKGKITEAVPGTSIKMLTRDGNLFIFQLSEIEKITFVDQTTEKWDEYKLQPEGISRGYRGFADIGYSIGVGDWKADRFELSTVHGYQFNPHLFVGGGIGLSYYTDAEQIVVPIFGNIRTDLLKSDITPFINLKTGYSVGDIEGAYVEPSIGCRFKLNKKMGLNISAAYSLQQYDFDDYYYYYNETFNLHAISLKIGFDF